MPFATFKNEDLTFFEDGRIVHLKPGSNNTGAFQVISLSDIAIRAACKLCHTPLGMTYLARPDNAGVTLGTIDESSIPAEERERFRPTSHIFVSQNLSWYDVKKDGLPCYERFTPGFKT